MYYFIAQNLLELLLWQHGMHVANLLDAEKASGRTLEAISTILQEIKTLINSTNIAHDEGNQRSEFPDHESEY